MPFISFDKESGYYDYVLIVKDMIETIQKFILDIN